MMQKIEKRSDITDAHSYAKYWQAELKAAKHWQKDWEVKAKDVVDRYRNKTDNEKDRTYFNVLWSNTETIKPHLYNQDPKPYCAPRAYSYDPTARTVADLLEKSVAHSIDVRGFGEEMRKAVEDYLLPGRAVMRVYYDATVVDQTVQTETQSVDEFGNPVIEIVETTEKIITDQIAYAEYVHWMDFLHSPARKWNEVSWVAFRHVMTRENLIEEFGEEIGKAVPLDYSSRADAIFKEQKSDKDDGMYKMTEIWEIHDKYEKRIFYIHEGFERVLRIDEDSYKLPDFFPCTAPIYCYLTNNTLLPIPEYTLYEQQAKEVENLSRRIAAIVTAIRVRGAYDESFGTAIQPLMSLEDNKYIPIKNFAERGGNINQWFSHVDIEPFVATLTTLTAERQNALSVIYQLIGMSDIMRGSGEAEETATGKRLKAIYGGHRLRNKQRAVQGFIRDNLRLLAHLIAEHYTAETFMKISGTPVDEQIVQLMRDDRLVSYRVDIETDSTIEPDLQAEKEMRTESMLSLTAIIERLAPLVQQGVPAQIIGGMIRFLMAPYKSDREFEGVIEGLNQYIMQRQMQPQQQQPDPQLVKAQAQMMATQQKEADSQRDFTARMAETTERQRATQMKTGIELIKTATANSIKPELPVM